MWHYDGDDLRTWDHEGAFDTAKACQDEKARVMSEAMRWQFEQRTTATNWKPEPWMSSGPDPKANVAAIRRTVRRDVLRADTDAARASMAVCIASDDPRLR